VDNPTTGEPIAGVPVDFKLEVGDDDDQPRGAKKVLTDRSGYTVVEFNLPNAPPDFEGKVEATATRGDFSEEESIDIKFPDAVRLTLTTDKPLYQPGQSVHMRLLAFGPDNRALANVPVKVTLADDQGQTQFEDTFNTSKFGVAKADWEIPQKSQLGDVSITAEVQGDRHSGQEARSQVRTCRYELTIYKVKVHPDRAYDLPGQNARVEVQADYPAPLPELATRRLPILVFWDSSADFPGALLSPGNRWRPHEKPARSKAMKFNPTASFSMCGPRPAVQVRIPFPPALRHGRDDGTVCALRLLQSRGERNGRSCTFCCVALSSQLLRGTLGLIPK